MNQLFQSSSYLKTNLGTKFKITIFFAGNRSPWIRACQISLYRTSFFPVKQLPFTSHATYQRITFISIPLSLLYEHRRTSPYIKCNVLRIFIFVLPHSRQKFDNDYSFNRSSLSVF